MGIAAAGKSLIKLLKAEVPTVTSVTPLVFKLTNAKQLEAGHGTSDVTMHLYRIDVSGTPRHVTSGPTGLGAPQRSSLNLELRYLLTAWSDLPETQQEVLEACMTVLEHNAILSGAMLHDPESFATGQALKITLESLTTEDMMRIWDSVTPSFRLSIPYAVRTIRLAPVQPDAGPLVDAAVARLGARR